MRRFNLWFTPPAKRFPGAGVLRIALPLVLLLAVAAVAVSTSVDARRHSANTVETVTAPLGKSTEIDLPDGSTVLLGPGATISYSPTLATDARREVHVEGEAYFEVVDAPARPFAVRAGKLIADIDAKCAVRAYPEDPFARIVVREGEAVIAGEAVSAGEVGWIRENGEVAVERADTTTWFAWTQGRLAFAEAFRDAIPQLSRWYDVELHVAGETLGDAVLVATLPDTIVEGTLEAIAYTLSARIEREGRRVTFFPVQHSQTSSPDRRAW